RLEVHVRIDEAGDDEASRRVERLAPVVASEAGDEPVDDRDVGLEPLLREHREHASAADDEISRLVAAGDGEPAAELLHGAKPTAATPESRNCQAARRVI